jgi:hypothetical protein
MEMMSKKRRRNEDTKERRLKSELRGRSGKRRKRKRRNARRAEEKSRMPARMRVIKRQIFSISPITPCSSQFMPYLGTVRLETGFPFGTQGEFLPPKAKATVERAFLKVV